MEETEFVRRIRRAGGRVYVVGGWVRDREMGVPPRDKDYVVAGVSERTFCEIVPGAVKVGRGFPVYRVKIDGRDCDVAFTRSERKTGRGYRGFDVSFSSLATIEDDLYRRDSTVNAMAVDLDTGELVDPYGGVGDVREGVIRAVSEHFADDPVRALRAARQAAQFGFRIERKTILMMERCRDELADEPRERIVKELASALACEKPSAFFANLNAARVLDVAFPFIHSLVGARLSKGQKNAQKDAFARTMETLDRAAGLSERVEVRFAALVLDMGDGSADAATRVLGEWNRRETLPRLWMKCGLFAARERARVWETRDPAGIADFLERLRRHPIGFDGFEAIVLADRGSLPLFLQIRRKLMAAIESVKAADAPEGVFGRRLGSWLEERRASAVAEAMNEL
jgi:tRNA nucleotidyltransferase (CCA-adding enzyme)